MVNKLLVLDLLIMIAGLLVLFVRPYGWDISYGIAVIVISFIVSIGLFLVKLKMSNSKNLKE